MVTHRPPVSATFAGRLGIRDRPCHAGVGARGPIPAMNGTAGADLLILTGSDAAFFGLPSDPGRRTWSGFHLPSVISA